MSEIATRTLGFSRAPSASRPVKLFTLAEAALRIHQRTIEAKQVHLVKNLPDDVVAEVCSGEMLQVISNLITNALDALPPEGTLALRLRKRPGKAQIVIADNGHGIPREYVGKVFKPFFTTKEERGTGLGLAISKKIVERHQGSIKMRTSVRPGKAAPHSRFIFPQATLRRKLNHPQYRPSDDPE